jgi:hypothetical protein
MAPSCKTNDKGPARNSRLEGTYCGEPKSRMSLGMLDSSACLKRNQPESLNDESLFLIDLQIKWIGVPFP